MLKKYLCSFGVLLLPAFVMAQSLSISVQKNSAGNNLSQFQLSDGTVEFNSSGITFSPSGASLSNVDAYGVSPDLSLVGILSEKSGSKKASIFDTDGVLLSQYMVADYKSSDPSLGFFPFNSGGSLVRDNIISFNLYTAFGETETTISAGSQSSGGQGITEVAMDADGATVVMYIPKIKKKNSVGSKAQLLNVSGKLSDVFYSQDRIIKNVQVSADGQFLMIITAAEGTDDEVVVMDKFGNVLNKISGSEDLIATSLSEDAEHITVYSARRALVYNTLSGERLGSTSFNSDIISAHYFAEDEILLALSGRVSTSGASAGNLEFHAIHLGKRKVQRKEFSGSIGLNPALQHYFERVANNRYRLMGANKILEVKARF